MATGIVCVLVMLVGILVLCVVISTTAKHSDGLFSFVVFIGAIIVLWIVVAKIMEMV